MPEDLKIPAPDDSGSSGKQSAAVEGDLVPAQWQGGSPVPDAVDGLVAASSKVFGSHAASTLLAASLRQGEVTNRKLESRCEELDVKVNSLRDNLEQARISNANLKGRIQTQKSFKRIRRICVSLASILVAVGVGLVLDDKANLGLGAFSLSIPFLVVSWFLEDKQADE